MSSPPLSGVRCPRCNAVLGVTDGRTLMLGSTWTAQTFTLRCSGRCDGQVTWRPRGDA